MADDGRLRYVTKVLQSAGEVERDHTHRYPCPAETHTPLVRRFG